jgi:hypothetical protein
MARRKRGAALFDVIHHDARFPAKHAPPSGGASASGGLRAWLSSRRDGNRSLMDAPPVPMISHEPPRPSGPGIAQRIVQFIRPLIPSLPRFGFTLDEECGNVRFQLSYSAAIVAIVAFFLLVAMGYVIGRHGAQHALPALAEQTTDELRAGPAHPDVLDVSPQGDDSLASSTTSPEATPAGSSNQTAIASATAITASGALKPAVHTDPSAPSPLPASLDGNRTVGLNYVIVQSYPPAEKELAREACDLLNRNGVLCTVETGISYAPKWSVVIGVVGFPRVTDSPQYDSYIARIEQIGKDFGKSSHFKQFEPRPYKWKDPKKD